MMYFTIYLSSIRKERINTLFILIGTIINLILNIIFIPIYSIYAAAITTIFGYFIVLLLQTIYLIKLGLFHKLKI